MTTPPLHGVRVLAVEQMQSLPYATQLLGRLGAEVVKVEHPERGDLGRGSTPTAPGPDGRPVGATFLRNNSGGKRSVAMDLKQPAARDLLLRLAPRFDVLAENFKAGTMVRFGLGPDEVRAAAPRLVYLSVSGFGTTDGPYRDWPAFAPVAEAMSGLYTINRPAGEELKVSPVGALGDTGTGLFAVIGVLAALRRRDLTGEGAHVDVAMLDAMIGFADLVPNYWSLGKDPRTPTALINDGFPVAAGEVVVQIGREHQFARLCELLGRPEWLDDERFATREGWREHLDVIRAEVAAWAGDRSTTEVAEALAAAGIAAAPVLEAADLVVDDHVAARHMLHAIDRPDGADPVLTPGNPVKISGADDVDRTRPPTLGEHTDEVLVAELGLDDAELAELRAAGAIG